MMRKTIFNDLKCGSGNFDSMPSVAGVPLRPLYAQKQDIDCCQSERLGLDEQIQKRSTRRLAIAIGVD